MSCGGDPAQSRPAPSQAVSDARQQPPVDRRRSPGWRRTFGINWAKKAGWKPWNGDDSMDAAAPATNGTQDPEWHRAVLLGDDVVRQPGPAPDDGGSMHNDLMASSFEHTPMQGPHHMHSRHPDRIRLPFAGARDSATR